MIRNKILALCLVMALAPATARADGYVLGAGRWTCADAIRLYEAEPSSESYQFFGWLMGYWSAATFERETRFIDIVENAGGKAIADATIAECRAAKPETLVYKVTQSMIRNTK